MDMDQSILITRIINWELRVRESHLNITALGLQLTRKTVIFYTDYIDYLGAQLIFIPTHSGFTQHVPPELEPWQPMRGGCYASEDPRSPCTRGS
jgi:hypothetical protein